MNDNDFLQALSQRIEHCSRTGHAVHIEGGGSKHFYGGPVEGEILSTRGFAGILEYEPTELVVTAKAGTLLSDIEALVASQRQMLAFEPPRFSKSSTIGGVIASGLAGPRRGTHGGVRDFVLGATLMDGRGQVLHFGGTVMKNVAGYDVSRLLAGSMGCMGVLLDISVKVLPIPATESTLRFAMSEAQFIIQVNRWLGDPLPISGSHWHAGVAHLRLSGAQAAVNEAIKKLGGELLSAEEATDLWNSLRDQTHPFFNWTGDLYRLSLPATSTPVISEFETLIEWAGSQRWLRAPADSNPATIQALAQSMNGHATLYHTPIAAKRAFAFTMPAPTLKSIQQKLKKEFDPAGIFNPGRMAPIF
jgi:glycolate oxidase FAD binding subunit